jgi:hypothetical protein
MAQRNELALPEGAGPVITRLVHHYRRQPELAWMYGHGSVFSGLRNDSDLDLILVWDQMPAAETLPDRCRIVGFRTAAWPWRRPRLMGTTWI